VGFLHHASAILAQRRPPVMDEAIAFVGLFIASAVPSVTAM
jgi:hypothetical protein